MRVLLADGDAEVRRALRVFLAHDQLGMHVVGEVAEAAVLWSQIHNIKPDLLLLDWGLFGSGGTAALASLHDTYSHLVLTKGGR